MKDDVVLGEVISNVIIGAEVKHVSEDADGHIVAILFQKEGHNYKLHIPVIRQPYLIEQLDWI